MGFGKTLGKVIFSPLYMPYKLIKNEREKRRPFPVMEVVQTRQPDTYRYFFESQGMETTTIPSRFGESMILIWNKGVKEQEKAKIIDKLRGVI